MKNSVLRIDGEVQIPGAFDFADMTAMPDQIADVAALIPGRHGAAVPLRVLLETAGLSPRATHLTLHADDGDYAASVPLAAVANHAILVYRVDDAPLPASQGGPVRFLIPDVDACGIGEVDACANVKGLGRIEVTHGPGKDTRPTTR
jgi:2-dehydropantoate 2-reductase